MDNKKKGYLYLITTFVLFGSLYVVGKFVLGKLPTFTISFLRFALAFLTLTVLCRGRKANIEKEDYKYVFLIGVAGYFIAVGAQLLGIKYAGASLASLINSMGPVAITAFGAMILKEKMTINKVIGILLALGGVYAILGAGGAEVNVTGVAFSVFALLLWSFVSVMTRKVTQKYESIQITRLAVGIAAVCYLPVAVGEVATGQPMQIDAPGILGLIYMGTVCTGVAYMLWNKSLSMLEASTCSAFYPIQPLVSTILGVIFLKEQVGINFFVGAALIVVGVLISLMRVKNAGSRLLEE